MAKLILICAPSGTGKTTITRLLKTSDERFRHVKALTTRDIRFSEHGREEKEQISIEELNRLHLEGKLISKNEKDGDWYGIKKDEIFQNLELGLTPVLEWDIKRINHFDKFCATFKVILEPESLEVIIQRAREGERNIDKRLQGMIDEVALIKSSYYDSFIDLRILNRSKALNDTILKIREAYFGTL